MSLNSLWARLCALSIAAGLMFAACPCAEAQAAAKTYNAAFSIAQQSTDSLGRTVLIMQGTGDLPGVLTLVLSVASDGSISGGEWALNVSYTAPMHPGAAPDPTLADPDSAVGEQLIQKGTLSGSVSGGSTSVTNGLIAAINSLQLVIARGTLQFAGVTQGNGSVTGTHIDDRTNSTAYASLTF